MVALDLGMPGMDGIELLRFLAEQDYRAPVLIVSGFDRRILEFGISPGRGARPVDGRADRKTGPLRRAGNPARAIEGDAGELMRKADAQLLSGFERALEKQQLHMVYQPKVSLRDGR